MITPEPSAERDGLPLPALTVPTLLSQLAFRVFGPKSAVVRSVLDYLGLWGFPASRSTSEVALRHRVAASTIRKRVMRLQESGQRLPIAESMVQEIVRPIELGEDALSRRRIAVALGLNPPEESRLGSVTRIVRQRMITASQVLAAVGPLGWDALFAAVRRRRTRHSIIELEPAAMELQAALIGQRVAVPGPDGRWHLTSSVVAPAGWVQLLERLTTGRLYSARELTEIFVQIGFGSSTANRHGVHHPLLVVAKEGPRRYALLQAKIDASSSSAR